MTPRNLTAGVCWFGAAGVLLILACGAGAPAGSQDPGHQVYSELKCGSCHGEDLGGTRTAPPLRGVAQRWTEDSLLAYLEDPSQVTRSTPNISYRNESYRLAMPSFRHVDEQRLEQLVAFLLTR